MVSSLEGLNCTASSVSVTHLCVLNLDRCATNWGIAIDMEYALQMCRAVQWGCAIYFERSTSSRCGMD